MPQQRLLFVVISLFLCVLKVQGQWPEWTDWPDWMSSGNTNQQVEQCGARTEINKRIVGGSEATAHEWPWQIQIIHPPFNYQGKWVPGRSHICGGALIKKDWVLTAAHCVKPNGKWAWWSKTGKLTVVLGEHDRDTSNGQEQKIRVKRILAHSGWDHSSNHNDIALLQLDQPAQLNSKIGTVCIPGHNIPINDGKECWVAGWGLKQVGATPVSVLQELRVSLATQNKCRAAFAKYGIYNLDNVIYHPSVLCAGRLETGKGTCHGDSGGPMVCQSQGRWYIEGVVSWGLKGCSDKEVFDGYASVRYFRDWINEVIDYYHTRDQFGYFK